MPRRMAILAFLAVAACRKEDEGGGLPEVAIAEEPPADDFGFGPDPRGGRLVAGDPDAPVVCIRLGDGGLLQTREGGGWKDATLNDVSEHLAAARDGHAREMRRIGKPEWDEPDGYGVRGSSLFLSIEADPAVPWQHVQWLLTLAAEQHYYKLQLSDGARRMLAFVPLDAAIEWIPDELPPFVVLQVDIIPRAGVLADWNGAEALRPTRVAYRTSATRFTHRGPQGEVAAGIETRNLGDAGSWIAQARKVALGIPRAKFACQIRAGHTVPFARVFDAMETFLTAGVPDVDLLSHFSIPTRAARAMSRLPYPTRIYDTPLAPPEIADPGSGGRNVR